MNRKSTTNSTDVEQSRKSVFRIRQVTIYEMCDCCKDYCKCFRIRQDCCKCTKTLDLYGAHAITCGNYNNETKRRHDLIIDLIGKWAKKAGFDVTLDQYGLFGLTDARKPADVLIHVYHNGETWAFDVVVKVPFAKDAVQVQQVWS